MTLLNHACIKRRGWRNGGWKKGGQRWKKKERKKATAAEFGGEKKSDLFIFPTMTLCLRTAWAVTVCEKPFCCVGSCDLSVPIIFSGGQYKAEWLTSGRMPRWNSTSSTPAASAYEQNQLLLTKQKWMFRTEQYLFCYKSINKAVNMFKLKLGGFYIKSAFVFLFSSVPLRFYMEPYRSGLDKSFLKSLADNKTTIFAVVEA